MAEVTLTIGGYNYQLACRDGEEAHLARLGSIVDSKVSEARAAVGNASEVRQLLLSALLFADEMLDARRGVNEAASPPPVQSQDPALLEAVAERAEAIATKLEKLAQTT
jgi:cell division protein ZapA